MPEVKDNFNVRIQNRVSVSVGDLFGRFGLVVTWDSTDGALSNAKLEAKTIQHLGDAALSETLVGPKFVSLVRRMLQAAGDSKPLNC